MISCSPSVIGYFTPGMSEGGLSKGLFSMEGIAILTLVGVVPYK
ncbi:MAG: hypothetical protein WD098_12320 [Balneolales bacterium]